MVSLSMSPKFKWYHYQKAHNNTLKLEYLTNWLCIYRTTSDYEQLSTLFAFTHDHKFFAAPQPP